ncbi:serine--tRNA ligase, chloroplastic/mitochondrial isoform X2 [Cryptomeria japonica]|uniref:serine--tRNA ligase, chloroplastic/mitochondrial isoform X2 n=1 Tax=Cryptomeria japonica TaxID=3369 RepID=UPI0027DA0A4B|nr:serine--tRNA ligase, chloroplastic/mitochondrial isoform X2 [Cryptomeria japonica]
MVCMLGSHQSLNNSNIGTGRMSLPLVPSSVAHNPSPVFASQFLFRSIPNLRRRGCDVGLPKSNRFLRCPMAALETQHAPSPFKEENKDRPSWRASIDFKWIRDNKEAVALNVHNRKSSANVELVVALYDQFSNLQTEVESLRAERNVVANKMKGKLDPSDRTKLIEEGKRLKDSLAALEDDLAKLMDKLQQEAQLIPNLTHPDVPIGGEDAASVRKMIGRKYEFQFPVKDHVELGQELDLFDFESAAEVSGSKFYYLKNEAVLLEMGLINWTLSELTRRGYVPLSTPDIVRSSVLEKCGFQPRAENTQVYSINGTDQCLAGTSEIPVGGMYMDRIIADTLLPIKHVAFSHCFRTEAGAAGYATRGLYRVHQFSKVEMFVICHPEESDLFHEELISIEEDLFSSLGLHFKTLDMPSEDLGAPAYRKYDVEAWMPGLGRYGEISSASNCTDYQSRRLNIRYRPVSEESTLSMAVKPKKRKIPLPPLQFVHTLNATACAVPRMIISILENFQQEDGSVIVPEVLKPFMGGVEVIYPKSKQ